MKTIEDSIQSIEKNLETLGILINQYRLTHKHRTGKRKAINYIRISDTLVKRRRR